MSDKRDTIQRVSGLPIGYARVSTDEQDLTAQRDGLQALGVERERIYVARSLPDARDIADDLTRRSIRLNLGGSVYDPTDPVGRLLFNVLAMVAEFEADLVRARTREGHEGCQGQRAPARQAAQTQPATRGAPGRAAPRWAAHKFRPR